MAGYTRQDTANNISNNSIIDADDLDGEFNAIEGAFNGTTGHVHDGTSGSGAPILKLGPGQDIVIGTTTALPKTTATVDLGSTAAKFKNAYLSGAIASATISTTDVATIGGALGVTGATTLASTLAVTGATTLASTLAVTGVTTLTGAATLNGGLNIGAVTLAEYISDTVGAMVTSNTESGISVTYDDADNTLDFNVNDPVITLAGVVTGTATMTNLGNVTITTVHTSDPTITLTGDVTGSGTMTNLGNVSIALTVQPNSVALGTDTTGNYVAGATGGTGVTITGTAGEGWSPTIAIGQAVATNSNVTFANLTATGNTILQGNLTVSGTTTTVNTETINLADNIILLNSNEAGTPSQNSGIEVERGTSANKTLVWDEAADKWTVGSETFVAATVEANLTGNVTGNSAGTHTGAVVGNASTATTLATARTISLAGDVSGSVSFNGSANVSITATIADDSHNHIISNVDGLQTELNAKLPLAGGSMSGELSSSQPIVATTIDASGRGVGIVAGVSGNAILQFLNSALDTQLSSLVGTSALLTCTTNFTSSGNITAYSDARLKENVVTIDSALNKVEQMRGVYFNKIDDETKTRNVGVIAQEMEEVLPEAVHTREDGIKSVAYGNIVGVLIEAIKELKDEIEVLKKQVGNV
jgi:hypothetical protein